VNSLARLLFGISPAVRYVATYSRGQLELNQREGLKATSTSESDKYEELLVNPALLTLLSRRGDIDCGGLSYVLVRYGNFFQLVVSTPGGHVSVALEPSADLGLVERVRTLIAAHVDGLDQ
jgi:hypothetical protein